MADKDELRYITYLRSKGLQSPERPSRNPPIKNSKRDHQDPAQSIKDEAAKNKVTLKDLCEEERLKVGNLITKLEEEKREKIKLKKELNDSTQMLESKIRQISEEKSNLESHSKKIEKKYKKSFYLLKKLNESKESVDQPILDETSKNRTRMNKPPAHYNPVVNSYLENYETGTNYLGEQSKLTKTRPLLKRKTTENDTTLGANNKVERSVLVPARGSSLQKLKHIHPEIDDSAFKDKADVENENKPSKVDSELYNEVLRLKEEIKALTLSLKDKKTPANKHEKLVQVTDRQPSPERPKGDANLCETKCLGNNEKNIEDDTVDLKELDLLRRKKLFLEKKKLKTMTEEKLADKKEEEGKNADISLEEDYKVAMRVIKKHKNKGSIATAPRNGTSNFHTGRQSFQCPGLDTANSVHIETYNAKAGPLKSDAKPDTASCKYDEHDELAQIFGKTQPIRQEGSRVYDERLFEVIDELEQSQLSNSNVSQFYSKEKDPVFRIFN